MITIQQITSYSHDFLIYISTQNRDRDSLDDRGRYPEAAVKRSNRLCFLALPIIVLSLIFALTDLFNPVLAESLRVGIVGDQTGADSCCDPYARLSKGIALLNQQNVKAVIHVGDLVESESPGETAALYQDAFERAIRILTTLDAPWYLTPGDHDVDPNSFVPDSTDRSFESEFQTLYARRQPLVAQHLYYSFDLGNYHFVALDSVEHLNTDPRWGDVYLARISEAQYAWLSDDLRKHRKSSGIVVFMHQPLWYNWTSWAKVHQLLRQFPVRAVIAGHFHYCQDDGELDGIHYLVVGATGAKVKEGNALAGNVHHVTIMALSDTKAKVTFKLLDVDTGQELPLPLRVDMDRVQALDVMLGGLYEFASQNPICIEGGKLYSAGHKSPAHLRLIPIGNPIDLPLQVSVSFSGNNVSLINAGFSAKACSAISLDGKCLLNPAERVSYSNNSGMLLNNDCGACAFGCTCGTGCTTLDPLWQSDLLESSAGTISPGTSLSLKVSVGFQGEQGNFSLDRTAQVMVAASCR
jgi:hypothetical protein